jgi:predicted AlkP superfamily pyrophosphatase or phosphodiesterase
MQKFIGFFLLLFYWLTSYAQISQPRLIVHLVIDQLRGDLIQQYQKQFGKEGFNYLLDHGIDYHNTHHPQANTTTCVGHATIATGSIPAMHGIIHNEWYDRTSQHMIYCMEDLKAKILPTSHSQTLIPGRSPNNLSASTLSDELILSRKGRAFGVSFKDRSAITLSGHAGKAFWFDTTNGGFVTSTYYYNEYPKWITRWNKTYHPEDFDWLLHAPKASYQNTKSPVFHHKDELFGQTFPHHVTQAPKPEYFKSLSRTPKADQLTAHFAEQLLIEEQLGLSSNKTDYLAISFSAVDAIGHQFGPHSLEAEDNLLELDKTLAHLFSIIEQKVGLKNTLILLTADHGVHDGAAYLKMHHMRKKNSMNSSKLKEFIHSALKKRYALPPETLMAIKRPFIYLNHQIIHQHQLNRNEITHYLAKELTLHAEVFKAYSLPIRASNKDWIETKVSTMYCPYRSGDIYLVQKPNQSNDTRKERVTHGSPWQYDSYVPLLFAHPDFKPQRIFRPVSTTDIAPTLAALLLIKSPSAAVGQPLEEVLHFYD